MTTIAYKDGILAGDTRITSGNGSHIEPGAFQKVMELSDGRLFTFVGSVSHGFRLLGYLEEHIEDIPLWDGSEATGIVIDQDGTVRTYEGGGVWLPHNAKFGAWGSGSDYAYGAMRAGKSAAQAVKIAAEFNTSTGGSVRTVRLKKKRKGKK